MRHRSNTQPGAIGFGGALTLLSIGLKLGGAITRSWWWVLSPLWIPIAVIVPLLVVAWGLPAFAASLREQRWVREAEARRRAER